MKTTRSGESLEQRVGLENIVVGLLRNQLDFGQKKIFSSETGKKIQGEGSYLKSVRQELRRKTVKQVSVSQRKPFLSQVEGEQSQRTESKS